MSEPLASASRRSRVLTYVAGALALLGVGIAAYLLYAKVRIKFDATFASACAFSGKLNCDLVQTSPYSELFGVPIALLAIPTYVMMAFLAFYAALTRDRDAREIAHGALFGLGAATTLYAVYLAYLSAFVIKAFCLFCISMYVVQLAVAILAYFAAEGRLAGLLKRMLDAALVFPRPMPHAVVAFSLALAAATLAFHYSKQVVMERSLRTVAQAETPKPQTSSVEGRASGPAEGPVEVPVGPNDYVTGPASAPVTVVVFSDFQCPYCRILASEMKKLRAKYQGQARFVFKHFPMNEECNPGMSTDKPHREACRAAKVAHCAHVQGKFVEMHDRLFEGQDELSDAFYDKVAAELGLDKGRFTQCLSDPKTDQKVRDDVMLGRRLGLNSTPTIFVNGRQVKGLAAEILDYHIQIALKQPKVQSVEPALPGPDHPSMVKMRTAKGEFYIDTFEASLTKDGRAVSVPGATPAQVSFFEAKEACEKAQKRLCTEEEWVSACTGEPAVDNNQNGYFADDDVEGRMYPYGLLYEKGRCRDDEDKYQGEPGPTGVRPGCRTPEGIYDMAGNIGEWAGSEPSKAAVLGGDYRSGERAACNHRSATFGPGIKNNTTGFRCCADTFVEQPKVGLSEIDTSSTADVVGRPALAFELPQLNGQGMLGSAEFKKAKLTYLTFFASWCGPCKRELPALKDFIEK